MIKRLDVIMLGLLWARPRTGYDVRKWLDVHGRVIGYSAPSSQIYRQLARLEERGRAESVLDPRTTGPDAKLYSLTAAGRQAFDEWASTPYQPAARPLDPELQLRIKFTQHLGPENLLDIVRTELRFRIDQHRDPLPYDPTLISEDASPEDLAWAKEIHLIATQGGRLLVFNLIAWLEATEARLTVMVEQLRGGPNEALGRSDEHRTQPGNSADRSQH